MIKLIKPDCNEATTCRIYELQSGEIIRRLTIYVDEFGNR